MDRRAVTAAAIANVLASADVIKLEAIYLRRVALECEGFELEHSVSQRLKEMRRAVDAVADELATLRALGKLK